MASTTSPDGTTIGWTTKGQGPPLLLVHGTTADHTRWDPISPRLEEHFTVHAVDRRGRGGSTDGLEYHLLREAEDVAAVIEAIGGEVSVLAHSYGAVCSLEAALLTSAIGPLVLYEPPIPTGVPMYPPGVPGRIEERVAAGDGEGALEVFFLEVVGMPEPELERYRRLPVWEERIRLAPTISRELAIDRSYSFEPEKFSGLEVPIVLLLGGDSPPLFQDAIEAVEEAVPEATVVVLPGQRHIAMDTDPDMFLEAVLGQLGS